jgi:hypothetical protein
VKRVWRYVFNLLVALDQIINALFGGYPDETISLRAARACERGKRWGCITCATLDYISPDHCENTVVSKHVSILRRKL